MNMSQFPGLAERRSERAGCSSAMDTPFASYAQVSPWLARPMHGPAVATTVRNGCNIIICRFKGRLGAHAVPPLSLWTVLLLRTTAAAVAARYAVVSREPGIWRSLMAEKLLKLPPCLLRRAEFSNTRRLVALLQQQGGGCCTFPHLVSDSRQDCNPQDSGSYLGRGSSFPSSIKSRFTKIQMGTPSGSASPSRTPDHPPHPPTLFLSSSSEPSMAIPTPVGFPGEAHFAVPCSLLLLSKGLLLQSAALSTLDLIW